jgi:hypothetical protein
MTRLVAIARHLWFVARFGADKHGTIRSRPWWRLLYKLHLAPRHRLCERCGRKRATERVWSMSAHRYVHLCAWCHRIFLDANTNRRTARAWRKTSRRKT